MDMLLWQYYEMLFGIIEPRMWGGMSDSTVDALTVIGD